jgi:hypothetical protein
MEVTTWVKRRQGDTRAVTQVKPDEPCDKRPEADTLEHVEGHEKAAEMAMAAGESGGLVKVALHFCGYGTAPWLSE